MRKHRRDTASYTYYLSSAKIIAGLTGGTRVSVTPDKRILNKKKNIKYRALSPFIPGNERLLNKDNNYNPETTDTSISEKYYMSHTSPDDFTGRIKDERNTNDDDKYKEETLILQYSNKSVDNSETSDTLRDDSIIKTTKYEEAFIPQLMTMNFKYHIINL